jgi:hypothetical protein
MYGEYFRRLVLITLFVAIGLCAGASAVSAQYTEPPGQTPSGPPADPGDPGAGGRGAQSRPPTGVAGQNVDRLPRTGVDVAGLVISGLALILAGLTVRQFVDRRHDRRSTSIHALRA